MTTKPPAPWDADPFPGAFTVPTMLTAQEINYLHWLARRHCRGLGRIVELGCFLGGSTLALAAGLRANLHGARARGPILTYDSFEMDAVAAKMPLHQYRAGERFRPLFDIHLRDHLGDVLVREGWVPRDLPVEQEAGFYPEQEPVEVLFIDIAKHWLVHTTVLRCFGRHLIPGVSVVVQQDFKYYFGQWIALHMHQLRRCFEIMDDVPFSATMSFRYMGGIEDRLDELLAPGDIAPGDIPAVWDEIEDFWTQAGSLHAAATTRLNRAMHLNAAGRCADAADAAGAFYEWLSARETGALRASLISELRGALHYIRAGAATLGPRVRSEVDARATDVEQRLQRDEKAREPGPQTESGVRRALWRQVALRCSALGASEVALYGAGRHTAAMLRSGWPGDEFGVRLVALVDDLPRTEHIAGVPVLTPADLPDVDAVIVSSDGYEDLVAEAAERTLGHRALPILRIYGAERATAAI